MMKKHQGKFPIALTSKEKEAASLNNAIKKRLLGCQALEDIKLIANKLDELHHYLSDRNELINSIHMATLFNGLSKLDVNDVSIYQDIFQEMCEKTKKLMSPWHRINFKLSELVQIITALPNLHLSRRQKKSLPASLLSCLEELLKKPYPAAEDCAPFLLPSPN